MSLMIDNLEDLRTFLKHTGVKVTNVEEMKALLAAINANYNPDAARLRIARQLGITVPSVTTGVAGVVSFFIAGSGPPGLRNENLAALSVVWGVVALVSLGAVLASALLVRGSRRPSQAAGAAPQPLKTYQTDSAAEAGPPQSRNIMLPDQYP
jgi:hypothetical protein